MDRVEFLDEFEKVLEQGLIKICCSAELLGEDARSDGKVFLSPDIEAVWERIVKDYVADAVANFNDFPFAAIGFSAFLGMKAAYLWDRGETDPAYAVLCGSKGFDAIDDTVLAELFADSEKEGRFVSECMVSCTTAVLALIKKEQIEPQTDTGFYALVRSYGVLFRIGAAVELKRLGYVKSKLGDYLS
ncbi:MAG: hypothetical protein MJY42_02575 [Bacteroidales bacterium]|nr:hypothetical protein [Bacteroidales bacterium]